jgi:geranylgeranyl diphosphate synthase type I
MCVAESNRLVDLVQKRIDEFLANRAPELSAIAPELDPFIKYSESFLSGGKRFRALFCYWGWQAVSSDSSSMDTSADRIVERDLDAVISAAAALEVFHAAALVHDDIMDNSDTRRGNPAAHKRFEQLHSEGRWLGNGADFGASAALLLGDLLLSWSDELLDSALRQLTHPENALAARAEYNTMRTEVTVGQYLDVLEENSWRSSPEAELLSRAHRVIVYKSAKYSVEAPLSIGGALGGASLPQLAALRGFGLPLGVAFQLRDDMLGVFGDPSVTGKPAGDDLREGKRTVLIAMARHELPGNARTLLDELLGDSTLDDSQIEMLQETIRASGAIEKVEAVIDRNVSLALETMTNAPLSPSAKLQLIELADTVVRRTA